MKKAPIKKIWYVELHLFFAELWAEIVRSTLQWFPRKRKEMTVRDALKELKGYNKNKLIKILTNILADKQRVIPVCSNKKEVKTWSKRELIACIINELANRKDPAYKAETLKELEQKVKLA